MNNSASKYLKLVKSEIPWHGKPRRDFMKLMKNEVDDYCNDNPNVSTEALIDVFGEPKEVAKEFVQEIDLDILKRSAKISTAIKIALAAIVVFLIGYYIFTCFNAIEDLEGSYCIEEIEVYWSTETN